LSDSLRLGHDPHIRIPVRLAEHLGQAPVEDDDLAEVAQDDVPWLEVTVDDRARVGIGPRVAHRDEGVEEGRQVERLLPALGPLVVEGPDRLV
jgi:hypothetical protein